ncbi:MAG: butyrate kinase [Cellulosilyticaceae bacterium]
MKSYKILTINPGSTSTKVALYENSNLVFEEVLRHPSEELAQFATWADQYGYRKDAIVRFLDEKNIDIKELDGISARGGIIGPLPSGTYAIDENLVKELSRDIAHPANLAGIIARELCETYKIPGFIVDPVSVDEMSELAKVTGIPGITRKSKFHALNQKAIARRIAKERNKKYEEANFIVVHIGGGVSIGAHEKGKVVDVNNVIDGDGPMCPNRAGALPTGALIELCFSGKYTQKELLQHISSTAGLWAYLGTSDVRDVQDMIEQGNKEAELLYNAMAYQICKSVGAMATVLKGRVDGIIITGGVAYSKQFVRLLKERIDFLGEVIVAPGEDEMLALAEGAIRVLKGEEQPKHFGA